MPTLVSPGVSVTVTDESQYASAGPGTIPLIIIATANNKLTPDGSAIAEGTIPANAGVLELVTSQRELVQKFGVPFFEENSGNIVQGSELNEYGLHAAYSYLGIANRAYIIRAATDTSQLAYSQTAPRGEPVNGTYWFDIISTSFGLFRSNGNATPGLAWDAVTPLLPSDSDLTVGNVPVALFGNDGDLAVVTQTTDNFVYEKISGAWYLIGSTAWKAARPTEAIGTVTTPIVNIGDEMSIEGVTVTFTTGTGTLADIITDITAAAIPNITATNDTNRLKLTLATGEDINLADVTGTPLAAIGLNTLYPGYNLNYATHVSIPAGTHSGDIWVKTTDPNFGASYVIKRYSTSTGQFSVVAAPLYVDDTAADTAYGAAKAIGSLYVQYNTTGTLSDPIADHVIKRWDGSSWTTLTYEASASAPTTDPVEGTLWISDDFRVDIMTNDGNEWKGYLNAFPTTDPAGVQITSEEPTFQSDGSPLVANDLWLDSADLDNYPALYRFDGASWVLIDKTDQTTPFGIVFADARNNADGTDTGSEDIADMLVSDYLDADAPNPETYPAGMLLFNMRYSTYNVKEWQPNYFDGQGAYTVGAGSFGAPTYVARWVTKNGVKPDGSPYMGRFSQRQVVIEDLASIVVSNEEIRSEFVFFNLIACPGYPELIDEMIALNIDRKETAFIITDTPFRLKPDGTSINNWATNANNVASTDEFGRTNRYTYAAEYYPQGLSTDLNGNEVMVPASTIALRTYAYNDSVAYPWFPPAGTQRGIISNASSVGYLTNEGEFKSTILNQGQRDTLYLNNINPLAFLPGRGLVVYGDKTLHPEASALDRVNVARLVVYLRYQLDQLAQSFLFQLNTDATRDAAKSIFDRFLGDLIAVDAITDFAVVCDRTNNTPERIDRNELWIDVAIAPAKSINFIYIPIRIVNTGEL